MKNPLKAEEILFLEENYKNGIDFCAKALKRDHKIVRKYVKKNLGYSKADMLRVMSENRRYDDDKTRLKYDTFLDFTRPEVVYFHGFFWADGCATDKDWGFKFCIVEEDFLNIKENVIDKIGDWSVYKRLREEDGFKNAICISANHWQIKTFMREHNYHMKSHVGADKILSKIPDHLKHYWWRGYFDGDGCVSCYIRPSVSIASTYDYDWGFAQSLFNKLGITGSGIRKVTTELGQSSSIVLSSKGDCKLFLDYIYQNRETDQIGLGRKYIRYKNFLTDYFETDTYSYERRAEASTISNFKRKDRQGVIRGVKRNGTGWAAFIGYDYAGTYKTKNAAQNAYNYFGAIKYGNLLNPNPVEYPMTQEEIMAERLIHSRGNYSGITQRKDNKRWRVVFKIDGKNKEIGPFATEKEALEKRNQFIVENNLDYPIQEWKEEGVDDGYVTEEMLFV